MFTENANIMQHHTDQFMKILCSLFEVVNK